MKIIFFLFPKNTWTISQKIVSRKYRIKKGIMHMETSGRKVIELNIEDVLPNRFQPRIKFNEDAITEL